MKNYKYPPFGTEFGRWTVMCKDSLDFRRVICRCSCGTVRSVSKYELTQGRTKSCGCISAETTSRRSLKHGVEGTRLYHIWSSMKARCHRKSSHDYKNYGARGIRVCDEWLSFTHFMEWSFANGYSDNLSIDRVDNTGNYSPDNCRWVDNITQQNNKRTNVIITYKENSMTLAEWSRETGIPYKTLKNRKQLGWSDKKIIETPLLRRSYQTIQGR